MRSILPRLGRTGPGSLLWIVLGHPALSSACSEVVVSQAPSSSGGVEVDNYKPILAILFLTCIFGLLWLWNWRAKRWLEKNDRLNSEPTELDRFLRERQQNHQPTTLRYSEQEFQEMVAEALDELPREFDKEWKNVAVTVSTGWASDESKKKMGVPKDHVLFGTYSGYDRTKGLVSDRSSHVVVIYQPALEAYYGSDKEKLVREIRRVVFHELAHHLGMSHERMREIGL